jgi:rRNA-processing protein EBP2
MMISKEKWLCNTLILILFYSYNVARENVKKGMEILIQAKVPISRPDDFFAEMLKSDTHMSKVKQRLL